MALVLQPALDHHHKGEFDDAHALYRAILGAIQRHADVVYNLGVLLGQTDRTAEALPLVEQRLGLRPHDGQYWTAYISRPSQLKPALQREFPHGDAIQIR